VNELAKQVQPASAPAPKDAAGTASGATTGCVAFIVDEETRKTVQAVCQSRQNRLVIREGGSRDALEYATKYTLPGLLIVDVSDGERPLDALLPLLAAGGESSRIIAVGTMNDVALYREMMDSGVVDYLVKPVTDRALLAAVQQAESGSGAKGSAAAGIERSRLVAVVGTRGGVGASTLATNLAWLLAEQFKRKTTLVDLDLQFGTASLAFDVEPSRGLREALEQPNRIDSLLVSSAGTKVTDRLSILAAEESHEEDVRADPTAITLLLDELGRQGDFTIVDVPLHPATYRTKVLPTTRDIIIVTDLSLAGLRDCIRLCSQAQQLSPSARLIVVASRVGSRATGVSQREFEKALGHKIAHLLPEDAKASSSSAVSGKPLAVAAKSSRLTTALRHLAEQINSTKPKGKEPARSRFSWFSKE